MELRIFINSHPLVRFVGVATAISALTTYCVWRILWLQQWASTTTYSFGFLRWVAVASALAQCGVIAAIPKSEHEFKKQLSAFLCIGAIFGLLMAAPLSTSTFINVSSDATLQMVGNFYLVGLMLPCFIRGTRSLRRRKTKLSTIEGDLHDHFWEIERAATIVRAAYH